MKTENQFQLLLIPVSVQLCWNEPNEHPDSPQGKIRGFEPIVSDAILYGTFPNYNFAFETAENISQVINEYDIEALGLEGVEIVEYKILKDSVFVVSSKTEHTPLFPAMDKVTKIGEAMLLAEYEENN